MEERDQTSEHCVWDTSQ